MTWRLSHSRIHWTLWAGRTGWQEGWEFPSGVFPWKQRLGDPDHLCHCFFVALSWILHVRAVLFLGGEEATPLSPFPGHGVPVPGLVQVFPSLFGDFSLCFQLGPGLPPLQDAVVLLGIDVEGLLFQHLCSRQRDPLDGWD